MANSYTFTQCLGNTRFCINVHFAEDESAGTYEEKLLNVIRHEADHVQQKNEHGHDENDPAA